MPTAVPDNDLAEKFLRNLFTKQSAEDDLPNFHDDGEDNQVDENDDVFSTQSHDSRPAKTIYDHPDLRHNNQD